MARFVVDDTVTLSNTFTVSGAATDPTSVTLTVTAPDGTVTTPTPTNPSTGVYTADITADQAGTWHFQWVGTGAAADVEEGTFHVTAAGPDNSLYCQLDDLKAHLNISDTVDDDRLVIVVDAASRAIDSWCGRRFTKDTSATARTYYPDNRRMVRVDDFHTTTGLVVKTDLGDDGTYETTWDATDFQVEPLDGLRDGRTWPYNTIRAVEGRLFPTTGLRAPVQVTAQWGWASIPPEIRQACLIKAAKVFRRKDSPEGVAGFGEFGVVRISNREDPDVAMLLAGFTRFGGIGSPMVA